MSLTDRQPVEVLIPAQDEFPGYTAPDLIVQAEGIVDRSWASDVCAHFEVERVHASFPDVEVSLWVERVDPGDREYPCERRFLVDVTTGGSVGDLLGGADEPHLVYRGDAAAEALWAFINTLTSVRAWLNDSRMGRRRGICLDDGAADHRPRGRAAGLNLRRHRIRHKTPLTPAKETSMLDTERSVRPEPCASHADHAAAMAGEACSSFLSQGFGPEGDWEHSRFCATCGWASGDHLTDEDEV